MDTTLVVRAQGGDEEASVGRKRRAPEKALIALLVGALVVTACRGAGPTTEPSPPASPAPTAGAHPASVMFVGRVVTMDEPAEVEAVLVVEGRVRAIGSRAEVAAQSLPGTRTIDLGANVAYPGFIDAHSHWIGDREHYLGNATPADAMAEAVRRGWTSIAELWVNPERLAELEELDRRAELVLRVDAYLALNEPSGGDRFGDWYADRAPGAVSEWLRVQGVKTHFDSGWGSRPWWAAEELAATVRRAHDAGWQVAIHTVSSDAHTAVLDAFELALDGEPNARHHRIEHAIQVTDAQLARFVELGIVPVIHPDGGASDWVLEADYLGNLGRDTSLLARWRDFADAGLHVASAVDAPWIFPEFRLTDDIGRPFDQIAGGLDGRGRANPETPAWVLEQLLTAGQGLRSVTIDAAYALNDTANRGRLAPGTFGDITILSRDITVGTPDEIRSTTVIATIVGGVTAYCADPASCP